MDSSAAAGGVMGGAGGSAGGRTCAPGEAKVSEQCLPAGVLDDQCAKGFLADGRGGCLPVLPKEGCASGEMAIPGETTCRSVADCGDAPWGDIPIEAGTVYVDAANLPGPGDGTAADPFTTVVAALDAAAPEGMVAIAAGNYRENLSISRAVRIWGRCPTLVSLEGNGVARAMFIGADNVEVHSLGVTANDVGIIIIAKGLLLDRVWVHDTEDIGLATLFPTELTIVDSLIERATGLGVALDGSQMRMERTVVREMRADEVAPGRALSITNAFGSTEPSGLLLSDSVIRTSREAAIACIGSQLDMQRTVIIATQPQADGRFGVGVVVQGDALPSTAVIRDSYIGDSRTFGLSVLNATATIERLTIDGVLPQLSDGGFGDGVVVLGSAFESWVDISRSRITGAKRAGLASFDAGAVLEGVAFECNTIHLNGEAISADYSFDDRGGNACWCEDEAQVCKVLSTQLEPPKL